jgi:hypothetical protein
MRIAIEVSAMDKYHYTIHDVLISTNNPFAGIAVRRKRITSSRPRIIVTLV